jgi:glycosyltransferase involved in cell wall biosynthesis
MKILYVTDMDTVHEVRIFRKMLEYDDLEFHIASFAKKPTLLMDMGIPNLSYFGSNKFNFPYNAWKLKRILNEIRPDILHGNYVQTTGFWSAMTGYHPFLLMSWGTDILLNPDRSFIYRQVTKYTAKRADMIAADCEEVKKRIINLTNYPENRFAVFPVGIDLGAFNPKTEGRDEMRERLGWENKRVMIMTRNLHQVYDIPTFLRAIPEVVKEVPDARALICGEGPERVRLESIISELGIREYVNLAGYVQNDELPKYLAASDVYVSTSLSDGTALTLLEAMAVKLPLVVTDVPANLEWVKSGENGFVVPRGNSEALAEKLILTLKDKVIRKRFGDLNWKIAQEKADWNKNFEVLHQAYMKLFEESRG